MMVSSRGLDFFFNLVFLHNLMLTSSPKYHLLCLKIVFLMFGNSTNLAAIQWTPCILLYYWDTLDYLDNHRYWETLVLVDNLLYWTPCIIEYNVLHKLFGPPELFGHPVLFGDFPN